MHLTDIRGETVYVSIHFLHCRVSIYENHTCLAKHRKKQTKKFVLSDDSLANNWMIKLSTCLTKEAKLLVLKYFGRTFSANSFGFLTLNAFPSSFQLMISAYSGFYNLFL